MNITGIRYIREITMKVTTTLVNSKTVTLILSAIFVAIAGISLIGTRHKSDRGDRCIYVEGHAEREVIADTVDWDMSFEHSGTDQQELEVRNAAEKSGINRILVEQGIEQNEIEIYNYVKEDFSRRRNEEDPIKYRVGYHVHVKTTKVDLVAKLKNNITKLINGSTYGIVSNDLRVSCSDQESIDREVTRLAAENALERAKDLTKFLSVKLKKILTIETPTIGSHYFYPEADGITLNNARAFATKSIAGPIIDPENNASETMAKRKVRVSVRMRIAIK